MRSWSIFSLLFLLLGALFFTGSPFLHAANEDLEEFAGQVHSAEQLRREGQYTIGHYEWRHRLLEYGKLEIRHRGFWWQDLTIRNSPGLFQKLYAEVIEAAQTDADRLVVSLQALQDSDNYGRALLIKSFFENYVSRPLENTLEISYLETLLKQLRDVHHWSIDHKLSGRSVRRTFAKKMRNAVGAPLSFCEFGLLFKL